MHTGLSQSIGNKKAVWLGRYFQRDLKRSALKAIADSLNSALTEENYRVTGVVMLLGHPLERRRYQVKITKLFDLMKPSKYLDNPSQYKICRDKPHPVCLVEGAKG